MDLLACWERFSPHLVKGTGMKVADLARALREALDSEQLGTPVALRIHAGLPLPSAQPAAMAGMFLPLIRLLANETGGQISARQNAGGGHASVLWTAANGRSVLLTLISTPTVQQHLQVLAVGNHGITRLTGGEMWEEKLNPGQTPIWKAEIAESLKTGTSVPVGIS